MMTQRYNMLFIIIFVAIGLSIQLLWALKSSKNIGCLDLKQQIAASEELNQLFNQDIHDRAHWEKLSFHQLEHIRARDRQRRIRVSALFADGCFKSSKDYEHAALIFQHGDTSDHYYQTFIWSKRAVELGDDKQRRMMALSIDRYLVSIGQKQLFGSQSFASEETNWCLCMDAIEGSFPESLRQQYLGESLDKRYQQIVSYNQGKSNCKQLDCSRPLKPSPRGTVPGFW